MCCEGELEQLKSLGIMLKYQLLTSNVMDGINAANCGVLWKADSSFSHVKIRSIFRTMHSAVKGPRNMLVHLIWNTDLWA